MGASTFDPAALPLDAGYVIKPAFRGPITLVFELPSTAHLTRLEAVGRVANPVTIRLATATARNAFSDAGTIVIPASNQDKQTLELAKDARWVRATFEHTPNTEAIIERIAAYGTPGAAESASLAGAWTTAEHMSGGDDFAFRLVRGAVPESLPKEAAGRIPRLTLVRGDQLVEFTCNNRDNPWRGTIKDGVARSGQSDKLVLAGDGKLLVGKVDGQWLMAMRSNPDPGCAEHVTGNGPTVLALIRNGEAGDRYPAIDPAFIPGYRFDKLPLFLLDERHLRGAQIVWLLADCSADTDLEPSQQQLILNWVSAGHKFIIGDSDECNQSSYSFIPYSFKTVAAGAHGARGDVLALADPSPLGAGPDDPAHFLDTEAYIRGAQDLGDADIMQTEDPHWCGHLYSKNLVGASGWSHAYARYGRGLIIYDGLDRDDISAFNNKQAINVVRYQYAFPVQNDLPCNAQVASRLVLIPSVERQLPAGKPATVRVPMSLSYFEKGAAPREIALSIAGDARFPASVKPARVRIASAASVQVVAAIQLPARWSGLHAFTVTADGGPKSTARASIRINGSIALAKAFESQRRVRIYGIHFDVASARIQPQSEATISQIAEVLRAHPDWRMRVEGHTDSDGGAAYNQTLSEQRAQSVVNDLVSRYHVNRSRLVAVGYGLTRPVASNATEAGKALNRRVELVRL